MVNLKYIAITAIISISLFATSCKHKDGTIATPEISGCMDIDATNYNPKATKAATCAYKIDAVVGKYAVTDTFYHTIMTSATTGKWDTAITNMEINVSFVNGKAILFDALIQCNNYDNSIGIKIDPDNLSFSYIDKNNQYNMISGNGYFKGDTLIYHTLIHDDHSSGTAPHKGRGIRVR